MKKNGKYRFSLQFPAVTDQQIAVGDTLEKMGNRKSAIIVNAVFQYIADNPDLISAEYSHSLKKINNNPKSKDPILKGGIASQKMQQDTASSLVSDDGITSMLENLFLFDQT